MTRWLMPCIIATSLSGILAAILNAYHRFAATALQGVFANVLTIGFVVVGFHRFGIGALVLGTLAGAFAQLVVQVPAFFALHRFRVVVDWSHPGLRRLMLVLGPIAIGSAAGQVALFFDRYFASGLSVGSIAGMNYAVKLVGFPQQIFVAAIATVIFPVFAGQFASKNRPAMRRSIATGLKIVLFLTIPSVLGLCMLAGPIVQTLFERGAFTPADDRAVRVAAAVCRGRAGGGREQHHPHALPVRLQRRSRNDRHLGGDGRRERAALALLAAESRRARSAAGERREPIVADRWPWERSFGGCSAASICAAFCSRRSRCSAAAPAMGVALAVVQIYRVPPEPTFVARATNLVEHLLFGGFLFLALARIVDSEELDLAIDIVFRRKGANWFRCRERGLRSSGR